MVRWVTIWNPNSWSNFDATTAPPVLDLAQDHADLGAALNGFSLNEKQPSSTAIEMTGQAADTVYMSTTKLVRRPIVC